MKQYILQGKGKNIKRQTVDVFVSSVCDGGCALVYCESLAQRFTREEAEAIKNGRHACQNFEIVEVQNAEREAEFAEYDAMHQASDILGGYDPSQDIDSKYFGYGESVGSPTFSLQYEAGRNEVERLLKAGQREQAKALCIRLTQWNIEHNVATLTKPVRTLDQALAA